MDFANTFWNLLKESLGEDIPMSHEVHDGLNEIAKKVLQENSEKKDTFLLRTLDIPSEQIGTGLIKKDQWIWFIALLNKDGAICEVPLSFTVRDPEMLRTFAKKLNKMAEQIEELPEELLLKDTKVSKYRKKPVEIEAIKWNGMNTVGIYEFMKGTDAYVGVQTIKETKLLINTLEGIMEASVGDYIIRGVHGEFYACKPDIFKETYEPSK